MRTFTILILFTAFFYISGFAQVPDGINYQAVALDTDGNLIVGTTANWQIIENRRFNVRFSVLEGSPQGNILYQETHLTNTDPFGMFSLVIGHGTETGRGMSETLAGISWGVEKLFLMVELDIDRKEDYKVMDVQQMMSVPFAFHARSAGTVSSIQAADDHNSDEPIFSVKNSKGDIVFAVYESGVVINIDEEQSKGSRSGFAVGGFSSNKKTGDIEYLRIDPGSVRITIDDTPEAKGSRGGFAVGGFSSQKGITGVDYFNLTPGSASFQFNEDVVSGDFTKGSRGGFAVGGFSSHKSGLVTDYLRITPDSVRMYIDDSDDIKGSRGGFAVGGFSNQKNGGGFEYLRIDPGYIRVGIDDSPASKGSRGGFAVGGFSSQKKSELDYLLITPGSTQFLLDEDSGKGSRGGFAVGGFSSAKGPGIVDYMNLNSDSSRIYINDPLSGRGGFAVTERNLNKGQDFDLLYVAPERTNVFLKQNRKNITDGFSVFNREEDDFVSRLFSVTGEGTFVATLFTIAPVVVTSEATDVTSVSATAGGAVVNDGGAGLSERGVVYGLSPLPVLASAEKKVAPGTGAEPFTVTLEGLTPGTKYFVRTYAINVAGIGYGNQVEFTTAP